MYTIYLPETIDIEQVYIYLQYLPTTPAKLIQPFFNRTSKSNTHTGIVVRIPSLLPPGAYVDQASQEQQNDINNEVQRVLDELKDTFSV